MTNCNATTMQGMIPPNALNFALILQKNGGGGGGGDTNFDSKALYCSSAHTIFSLPFVFFGILVVQFTPRSFPLSLSLHVLLWICGQGIVLKEERAIPQLNQ
jgi:hypothetical protein